MPSTPKATTREQLYERVWQAPLRAVAPEFNLSPVGLAALCDRLHVPRPVQGHWQRLALGRAAPRPPLPPCPAGASDSVPLPEQISPSRAAVPAAESRTPIIAIRSSLQGSPRAVAELSAELEERKPDDLGMLRLKGEFGALIAVTRATKRRALLLLHSLCSAIAERGFEVAYRRPAETWGRHKLVIATSGGDILLSLREHLDRSDHKETDAEKASRKRGYSPFLPKYDHAPSGRLDLHVHGRYGLQSRWSDGDRQRLENVLGHIVLAIEAHAAALEQQRVEREARKRAYEEHCRRLAVEEEKRKREAARVAELHGLAERWCEAERLRGFIAAMEEKLSEPRTAAMSAWLTWARKCVDAHDPLADVMRLQRTLEPRIADGD